MPASCSTVAKNRFSLPRRTLHLCLSQIPQENELSLDFDVRRGEGFLLFPFSA